MLPQPAPVDVQPRHGRPYMCPLLCEHSPDGLLSLLWASQEVTGEGGRWLGVTWGKMRCPALPAPPPSPPSQRLPSSGPTAMGHTAVLRH